MEDEVRLLQHLPHPGHPQPLHGVLGVPQARGVEELQLAPAPLGLDRDRVAGDAGLGTGEQAVLAEDAVEQRRLAGVGAAEHGDAQRLGRVELAAVLLLAEGERLALVLLVRVEAGGRGQRLDERVVEVAEALAVLGGEGDRVAEA